MTLFGEFRIPTEEFALHQTLSQSPDTVVDIERVVASGELLTPYFWVSSTDFDAFEATAADDPSIRGLRKLDAHDENGLYRGEWTENIATVSFVYTHRGAIILDATGHHDEWSLQIRFEDEECLEAFHEYVQDNDISFELQRLYYESTEKRGSKYGLTQKQTAALETAWEMGYFESPGQSDLDEIAEQLDISKQALSQRLRRAHQTWIANALEVTAPEE